MRKNAFVVIMCRMSKLMDFIHYLQVLSGETHVYIQTHDFPDPDAVATAFGLQQLLKEFRLNTPIIYNGSIGRDSLQKMIDFAHIPLLSADDVEIDVFDKIIIVDGCKGNRNVTSLKGNEIAVIDHHDVTMPEDVYFTDIRPDYGACVSIIYSYYQELGVKIKPDTANAMLIGLQMDTALLTRGICDEDIRAFASLYHYADIRAVNDILRNNIRLSDLDFFRRGIERLVVRNSFGFCYFEEGCSQNLMAIIADFFLSLKEADFIVVCAKNGNKINFSLRSEIDRWHAAEILKNALASSGYGGGHKHMAGGIYSDAESFDPIKTQENFLQILKERKMP